MATLGDILAAAKRSAGCFERWLDTADPALAEAIRQAAEQEGSTPAGYARIAVADFSRLASADTWTRLAGLARDSSDPGLACLAAMVRWHLAQAGQLPMVDTERGNGS